MIHGRQAATAAGVVAGLALLGVAGPGAAQPAPEGWPQYGGPARSFQVAPRPLLEVWPDSGPPERWRRPLGEGYSTILERDGLLVTMFRDDAEEVIIALEAATGETRWEHRYEAPLAHDGYVDIWFRSAGNGPFSTPLIAGDTVVAVGVDGRLHALALDTGAVRWSHDLVERFALTDYNAFASSPIAYQDTVILPLGGSAAGLVAFARETGAVVWQGDAVPLAPGSPLLIDVDGHPELVVWAQQAVVGVDPATGAVRWRHGHPNDLGLNVSMPVWGDDGRLFVSSGYGGGSRLLELGGGDAGTTVSERWATPRLRIHFGNAVRVGPLIVGSSGDFGPAFLTALDVETGEERWRDRSFARAQLVAAGDQLVIVDEDGEVALAAVSPDGLAVSARHAVLAENAWTAPTLIGTTLYLRDRREVVALDLTP